MEQCAKVYHTSDMSSILVESTNHYAAVYGLNCRKLKDSIAGHQYTVEDDGTAIQGYS